MRGLLALCAVGVALCQAQGVPVATCRTAVVGDIALDCAAPKDWRFSLDAVRIGAGLEEVRLVAECENESVPPAFSVRFATDGRGLHHMWDPFGERFPCSWTSQRSSFSSGLPLRVNFDDCETNVLTFAVADALNAIRFSTQIELANLNAHEMAFRADFFAETSAPCRRYETHLRLDRRRVFWSEAAEDGVRWISAVSGKPPARPPAGAFEPLYSSWYVFRQTVTQDALEAELARAAGLGMKCVILDDGWQADRGAWAVNEKAFPDLAGHVSRVHRLGMKYLLWVALPHLLADSPAYAKFKDMCLSESPDQWGDYALDPRYPAVRAHLVRRLTELARTYDLDGFKLDFIDQFVARSPDLAAERHFKDCDLRSVPSAVERLLAEITDSLRKVKPDMMIEFRQRYVGPIVRQYGHMLRANDCPGDFEANRYRTLALRITSQGSAVHSDMLLWRPDDPVSEVKRQIWNVVFSVVQYSAYLGNLPSAHKEAVREMIRFAREHRETLLDGRLVPHHPELGYPSVEAVSEKERIVVVYQPECLVRLPNDGKPVVLVNATTGNELVVETTDGLRRVPVASGEYEMFGNILFSCKK